MVKHPHVQELSLSCFCGEDGTSAPALSLMQRPVPWLWITAIALLLLAPGFTAREGRRRSLLVHEDARVHGHDQELVLVFRPLGCLVIDNVH